MTVQAGAGGTVSIGGLAARSGLGLPAFAAYAGTGTISVSPVTDWQASVRYAGAGTLATATRMRMQISARFAAASTLRLRPSEHWSASARYAGAGGFSARAGAQIQAVTWSEADTSLNNTLSGGDLTVTKTANDAVYSNTRASLGASSGKRYFEFTFDTITLPGSEESGIGLATTTLPLDNFWPGLGPQGIGWYDTGNVYFDWLGTGVALATVATFVVGDRLSVAVDFTHGTFWLRVNSGNWNNIAGANPASNTAGISLGALAASTLYPVAALWSVNDAGRADFGPGYASLVPGGFTNWDGTAALPALSGGLVGQGRLCVNAVLRRAAPGRTTNIQVFGHGRTENAVA